jgi:hypothetical protein
MARRASHVLGNTKAPHADRLDLVGGGGPIACRHDALHIRQSPHYGGLSERTKCTMTTCQKWPVWSSYRAQSVEGQGQHAIVLILADRLDPMRGHDRVQPGRTVIGVGIDHKLIKGAAHVAHPAHAIDDI